MYMVINIYLYESIVVNYDTDVTVIIFIAYLVIVNLILYMDNFDLMVWVLIGIDILFDIVYDLAHQETVTSSMPAVRRRTM